MSKRITDFPNPSVWFPIKANDFPQPECCYCEKIEWLPRPNAVIPTLGGNCSGKSGNLRFKQGQFPPIVGMTALESGRISAFVDGSTRVGLDSAFGDDRARVNSAFFGMIGLGCRCLIGWEVGVNR